MLSLTLTVLMLACTPKNPATMANTTLQSPTGGYQPPPGQAEAMQQLADNFSRVYFDTDRATLTASAMDALTANALILGRFPDIRVEIQGHADERGTTDYNLALGQQRAAAVADYLTGQGVAASRLPVVSYGEERPAVPGMSETAWAQNRRAEFRILAGNEVKGTVQ